MRKMLTMLLFAATTIILFSCSSKRSGNPRVLVFSKTTGFRHASIPNGIAAIQKLGKENGYTVDTTENAAIFNEDSLQNYSAVIFLSTTGMVLDYRQRTAFERYIQAGGGFVGVHSATDTEYDWGWYGRLVGNYFFDHPGIHDTFPNVQPGTLHVVDKTFGATKHLPETWARTDEFYSFRKQLDSTVHVLINIDENSYKGGHKMGNHPMAWYHDYDGGRAFYTELGHTNESYVEENYIKHLLGGIQYAIGENKKLNYNKATAQYAPDEDRFTKTSLVQGTFYEPTEMTILPNYDVMIAQRRGEILLYKADTKQVKQVGFLNAYWKTLHTPGVNAEEGVLGLCKDPDFEKNHYVYIYYSPADTSVNRLSRFTFVNDTLDNKTEKVILDVQSQREICCHTGGSIAFGPDKLLYFSAGDNSTPFDEPGAKYVSSSFAPLNDVPGHQQYDARRSAGNSNDLRGKIMRIKVNEDGTIKIPEGNLFPKGTPNTRPEIYVMGNRNPYRISVDQKNSWLYWGEVGPDANNDSMATRGPKGYDEVNQARKAGFFGWPLFVGDNYAYHEYNYATGVPGAAFDPAKPVNNSRNNTGLKELPPAQPAFIWYPYGNSPDFPEVGTGGRNAMAGPVYYTDMFPAETRLPDYYNGKLFIYDWIRGWMKVVTMSPNGDFDKMEPFMEHTKLNNCIDMEVAPNGKIYLLEYGSGWFAKNPDAGLSVIEYKAGNRAPKIASIKVDKTTGALPFKVKAMADVKDPENDKVTYTWDLGNGTKQETKEPVLDYTFTTACDYKISVEAKDDKGAANKSDAIEIYAGNETPVVNIELKGGNRSFFMPGQSIGYNITVTDKGDDSKMDPANLFVSVDYIQGYDKAAIAANASGANIAGKVLTQTMDCKSCHKEAEKSIGPAFTLVSAKYAKSPDATSYLSQKIKKGGSGVWGDVAMAAHPNISETDLQQIIQYIIGLSNKNVVKVSLPATGTIVPPANVKPGTTLVLSASYTDKGGNNIKALTGYSNAALSGATISFTGKEKVKGFTSANYNGANLMIAPAEPGWFEIAGVDLTGVASVNLTAGWLAAPQIGFDFEVRLDSENGKLLGKASLMPPADKKAKGTLVSIKLDTVSDGALHNVVIVSKRKAGEKGMVAFMALQFAGK